MPSKLLDLLPSKWTSDPTMQGLANAVGRPLDKWRAALGSLHTRLDPWATPDDWLPWLMELTALPDVIKTTDVLTQRALAKTAFKTWLNKGTPDGVEVYLKAVAGVEAEVVRVNTSSFVPGISQAGDTVGPGELSWQYEVHVPAGLDHDRLRELLDPIVPGFAEYTIVELP